MYATDAKKAFNRTFKELKPDSLGIAYSSEAHAFNRTFKELKHYDSH